ncbi:MAG: BadF/BadG/BcrA/BcrD ATPase family protein [Candidatus Izemoplasmatales bacterium]|nr:BadF/BadG/BcrA/BcrD ATPase family protein [Candidatus Izemoplasmatales bacterium]
MKKVIIAVDAGGTKTKVSVIDENIDIVYEEIGNSGSPAVIREKAIINIFDLVRKVHNIVKDNYEVTFVQMGISGLGVIDNQKELIDELSSEIGVEVSFASDIIIGLYSIIEDKYDEGVLVLSGTGSAICATNGRTIRYGGGWGHLLTETGSAHAAVKLLICRSIKYFERHNRVNPLGEKFIEELKIKTIEGFKSFMYLNNKDYIASYSRFICTEANNGDKEAIAILQKCGHDLAKEVKLVHGLLKLSENAVMGFRGGLINHSEIVQQSLLDSLKRAGIKLKLVNGKTDPIYGAYYLAKRKNKI